MTKKETILELKNLNIEFNKNASSIELKKLLSEKQNENLNDDILKEDLDDLEPILKNIDEKLNEKSKIINSQLNKNKLYLRDVRQIGLKWRCFDGTLFSNYLDCSDYNLEKGHV